MLRVPAIEVVMVRRQRDKVLGSRALVQPDQRLGIPSLRLPEMADVLVSELRWDGRSALRGTHIEAIPACTCSAHTNRLVRARIVDSSAPRFRISHHETNLGSGKTSVTPKMAETARLVRLRERTAIVLRTWRLRPA